MLHRSSEFIKDTVPQYYDIDRAKLGSSRRHVTIKRTVTDTTDSFYRSRYHTADTKFSRNCGSDSGKEKFREARYPYEYSPKSCPKYGVATRKVGKFIGKLSKFILYYR